jgi:hypothetical protein
LRTDMTALPSTRIHHFPAQSRRWLCVVLDGQLA